MSFLQKVKTMLSPSEKLLFNFSYFLGVYMGISFFSSLNAKLIVLAMGRTNIFFHPSEIDFEINSIKEKQSKL